jgi:hypothetical protein
MATWKVLASRNTCFVFVYTTLWSMFLFGKLVVTHLVFTEFVECEMTVLSLQPGQFQINSGVLKINTNNKYNLHWPVNNLAYFQKTT